MLLVYVFYLFDNLRKFRQILFHAHDIIGLYTTGQPFAILRYKVKSMFTADPIQIIGKLGYPHKAGQL